MSFWMYVLRCADDSFYVGHTDDLGKRIAVHQDGSLGGYTAKRRPVTLLYAEEFDTRDDAFQRERQVKGGRQRRSRLLRIMIGFGCSACRRALILRQAQDERVFESFASFRSP
jgi:predicted GIY-YIG superfamily endonuclease